MKVRSDHRSEFSNLCNWKLEALPFISGKIIYVQLNLFITDTKGAGKSVRIIEVSVLEK